MTAEAVFGKDWLMVESFVEEPLKANFIGEIISAVYDCNCEICQRGRKKLEEMGREPGSTGHRYHVRIKPLTVYSKIQNLWLTPSRFKYSQWAYFVQRLKEIDPETYQEMVNLADQGKDPLQAIVGKVYEWEEIFVPTGYDKKPTKTMLPVRPVTGEELQKVLSEAVEITGEEVYLP